jgi:voltage-gated potassium channel
MRTQQARGGLCPSPGLNSSRGPTASGAVLLIYAASLAILETERSHPGSKINTLGDAVWWSLETVTTVGYGDVPPVTGKGRLIAVELMIGGISLVGLVTASLTSWIVERVAQEDNARQAATAAHIEALGTDVQQKMDMLRRESRMTDAVTGGHSLETVGGGIDGAVSEVEETRAIPVHSD